MALRESRYGLFWGCTRYPQCKGTHGAHPDGKPMGTPADEATKLLRTEVHNLLSQIWPWGRKSAKQAMYHWLKRNTRSGHVSMMEMGELLDLKDRLENKEIKLIREDLG